MGSILSKSQMRDLSIVYDLKPIVHDNISHMPQWSLQHKIDHILTDHTQKNQHQRSVPTFTLCLVYKTLISGNMDYIVVPLSSDTFQLLIINWSLLWNGWKTGTYTQGMWLLYTSLRGWDIGCQAIMHAAAHLNTISVVAADMLALASWWIFIKCPGVKILLFLILLPC